MSYVLIVEDDVVLARMYQKAMEIEGMKVAVATDGQDALAKVKAEIPQLVLLDIMMPKMSGYQVLDSLRADEATKSVPVVVLTNLHAQEDLQLATSKGANECVVKSKSDPMQVVAIAKKYVGGGGAQASDQGQAQQPAAPVAAPVAQATPAPAADAGAQAPADPVAAPETPVQEVPPGEQAKTE